MTPRKTFQTLDPAKQDRITQAAIEEFGERGFHGASINTLVRRLGIAKGSIFQYFGDKKSLFLFAFQAATEMAKANLRTVRERTAEADLFTRLEDSLWAGYIFLNNHPIIFRLYIRALYEDDIPFRDEVLHSLRAYSLKYLRSLVQAAAARGELRSDLDMDRVVFMLDAVMDRFLQTHAVRHLDGGLGIYNCSDEQARKWIAGLIDMIRLGVERKSSCPPKC